MLLKLTIKGYRACSFIIFSGDLRVPKNDCVN